MEQTTQQPQADDSTLDHFAWESEPSPVIIGDRAVKEITECFRSASASLPSAVLHLETFSLFESVTALEIMDPKMDTGYLAPGEALLDDYDSSRELCPEEVIWIMDRLFSCEMGWHEGYPLSQTVFTCHYVDKLLDNGAKALELVPFFGSRPMSPTSTLMLEVLRIYCLGLIMCCHYSVEKIVTSGHFYEEEDIAPHTYGRELFPKVNVIDFMEVYRATISRLMTSSNILPDMLSAILNRLEFRALLLSSMVSELEAPGEEAEWQSVAKLLRALEVTHHLGKPVLDAFSAKIQRRLASTVPPKPMVEISFTTAVDRMSCLTKECLEARRIFDVVVSQSPSSAENLKVLLFSFSSRVPEPLPYSRACLCGPILGCSDATFQEFLATNLSETVLPAHISLDVMNWELEAPYGANAPLHHELFETMAMFTEAVVQTRAGYLDVFRALLSNRCRVRRNLCGILLGFEKIQQTLVPHVEQVLQKHEGTLATSFSPMSAWSQLEKLRTMELVIQLGFELEVYLQDELASMYNYLSTICKERATFCTTISTALKERHHRLKHTLSSTQQDQFHRAYAFVTHLHDQGTATSLFAMALSRVFILLAYTHPSPKKQVYTETERKYRYELRMKPFLMIDTPALPEYRIHDAHLHPWGAYDTFDSSTPANQAIMAEWLRETDTILQRAKTIMIAQQQQFKPRDIYALGAEGFVQRDMADTFQSCILLQLTTVFLGQYMDKGMGDVKVSTKIPGERHPWWIVPRVAT